MAKKSNNELISALLYIILGVLLIVFKGATLGWAMTIAGIVFAALGIVDIVKGRTAGGAVNLIIGILILVLGNTLLNLVLIVLGVLIAVKGLVDLREVFKRKKRNALMLVFPIISIVVGMAAGCIPVVGFNMGAGKKDRVRDLFTRLLLTEAAVGAIALVIVEFFPHQLIGIFGAANESSYYTDFAIKAFRIYLCMMIFACVNKACFIFLQAMGKAIASTALSMIREVVFGVGFAILLPVFFGLDGVLYSMPLSDILTFVIAIFMIAGAYRELK
jgi:Na+-driven multidrug efflux pump